MDDVNKFALVDDILNTQLWGYTNSDVMPHHLHMVNASCIRLKGFLEWVRSLVKPILLSG